MTPRPTREPEPITLARLDGTARRLLREHADRETCLREVYALTTDSRVLGTAAGTALGAYRAHNVYDGDRVSGMLMEAGGDPDVRDEQAAATVTRLTGDRSGIGNP